MNWLKRHWKKIVGVALAAVSAVIGDDAAASAIGAAGGALAGYDVAATVRAMTAATAAQVRK